MSGERVPASTPFGHADQILDKREGRAGAAPNARRCGAVRMGGAVRMRKPSPTPTHCSCSSLAGTGVMLLLVLLPLKVLREHLQELSISSCISIFVWKRRSRRSCRGLSHAT